MRTFWTPTVLLTAALLAGCGDRSRDNSPTAEENLPETPATSAETPGSVGVDGTAVGPAPAPSVAEGTPGGRPVAGTPPGASVPPVSPPASAVAGRSPSAAPAPAPRPAPAAAPQFREVTVPAGTALPLELMTALTSETAIVEAPVRAQLRQALVVDGHTALPAGAVLSGNVIEVARAGRVQGRSRLVFRFTSVEVNGGQGDLRTNPLAFEGEATVGEDATKIGAGAVGGAIVGGIIGGGGGAAKGAAIGGAAGTAVVLATRGHEVTLAAGTNLAATLATPYTVRAPAR